MIRLTRSIVATYLLCTATAAMAAQASSPSPKAVITDNAASCDIGPYPAATLLLPYFEVDYNAPATSALDTVFTVVNTTRTPQIARMTIWTDLGFPAAWCSIFLTGYGMYSVSMYNIIARGNFPYTSVRFDHGALSADNKSNLNFLDDTWCDLAGGTIPASVRLRLQKILTTGERGTPGATTRP